MALTFTRTLTQPVTAQTINSAATYTSAQVDGGDATLFEQICAYLEIDGFAAAPAGNKLMKLAVLPVHTDGGSAFGDSGVEHPFTVTADQMYRFSLPLTQLQRLWKMTVENDTSQHTDANAVDAWVEHMDVTA